VLGVDDSVCESLCLGESEKLNTCHYMLYLDEKAFLKELYIVFTEF
jgi:hypothetical protein